MLRRIFVLLLCSVVGACSFKTDRSLGTGELKGRLVFQSADGTKLPAAGASVQLQGTRLAVKADTQGQFVVRGLTAASYSLKVAYNTSASDPTAGSGLVLPRLDLNADNGLSRDLGTVVLQRLATLDGVVRMNNEPLANARVVVPTIGQRYSTTDGAFTFDGLFAVQSDNAEDAPSVAAFVQLENGTVVAQKTFTLNPGARTSVSIDVDPKAVVLPPTTVSGSARLTDGTDSGDVTVQLYEEGQAIPVADATTSTDGLFVLTNVPPGVYTLVVQKEGYAAVEYPFVVVAGEPLSLPDFVLGRSSGSACGTDGTPVTGDVCDAPVPPRVAEVLPADGAKDVPLSTTMLSVTFTKEIDPTSVTTTSLRLSRADGTPVPGKVTAYQKAVMFEPTGALEYETRYLFEIAPGIRATDGSSATSALRFSFTTEAASTFFVTNSYPALNPMELNFPVAAPIAITFSKDIDARTAVSPNISLYFGEQQPLAFTTKVEGKKLTIQPNSQLQPGMLYILTLSVKLASVAGPALEQDFVLYFNAADDGPFQITTSYPLDGATDVIAGLRGANIQFSGNVDPMTDAMDVILTDESSNVIAGNVSAFSTVVVYNLTQGEHLEPGTTYTLTLTPSFKAANGRSLTGKSAVTFKTAEIPKLTVIPSPAAGATMAGTTSVSVQFSEAMNQQTIDPQSFYITDDQNNVVSAYVGYVDATNTASLNMRLRYLTHYTAHLTTSIRSLDGDALPAPFTWDFTTMPQPVAKSLAAGYGHSCMVLEDELMWCFGSNFAGQLGMGNTVDLQFPQPTPGQWKTVAVATSHSCGLDLSDRISCWGDTSYGQVGNGTPAGVPGNAPNPTQLSGTWRSLTTGGNHTCAIRTDTPNENTLWCWGSSYTMESGQSNPLIDAPTQVGTDADWLAVSAGGAHTCALRNNNTIWCFGADGDGRLGADPSGLQGPQATPLQVPGTQWASVSSGAAHNCALDLNGAVWCWGSNYSGQLGVTLNPGNTWTANPTQVIHPNNGTFVSVSVGADHTCAIDNTQHLLCWGANNVGQFGDGSQVNATTPRLVSGDQWSIISAAQDHTCGVNVTLQKTQCWGHNRGGTNGNQFNSSIMAVPFAVPAAAGSWSKVALGGGHTCAIAANGSLWCWGDNGYGQLGSGSLTNQQTPQQVGTDTDWTAIAAAGGTTCGLRTAGADTTLWCWGANDSNQVGIDTGGDMVLAPTQIGTDTDFLSVAVAANHACAARSGDTVRCWGSNTYGQLGKGTIDIIVRDTYASATSLAPWTSVAVGLGFSCFLGANGSATCVGINLHGELGRGFITTIPPNQNSGAEPSYVTVGAGSFSFSKLGVGRFYACGLTTTNEVACWGSNEYGTVGDGVVDGNGIPVNTGTPAVLSGTDWSEIGVGFTHVCGMRSSDQVWCWGANDRSQLGDPQLPRDSLVTTPQLVMSGAAFTSLKGGAYHTCAVKSDGSLWCWGDNGYGQTGFGHVWEQSPVDVVVK